MANNFIERLEKPEAGNKYYIRKANGGYSDAILGKPTDKDCNVLANCVGYAYGRFNEIGEWGECKYLAPVNAEDFMQYKGPCETGMTPRIGACMVWSRGKLGNPADGVGHLAMVERVISDSEVVTSESDYNGVVFTTNIRKKGDGNWGYGGEFQGFIYNPAPCCVEQEKLDYKVGDIVEVLGGYSYASSTAIISANSNTKGKAKVTIVAEGTPHPYHLVGEAGGSNVWGWVDVKDIKSYEKPVDVNANIRAFEMAALEDGFIIPWLGTPDVMSASCLVQQWPDGKNRYPSLTKLAQKLLKIPETGICDAFMTVKIREYQKSVGLSPDGGIGRLTWEKLLGIS